QGRQAVLDLAVGPRVLVDNDAEDAPPGELEGHLGARHASADDQDDVLRAHREAPHPRRARPGPNPTPWPVAPATRWPTTGQANDLARRSTSPGEQPRPAMAPRPLSDRFSPAVSGSTRDPHPSTAYHRRKSLRNAPAPGEPSGILYAFTGRGRLPFSSDPGAAA